MKIKKDDILWFLIGNAPITAAGLLLVAMIIGGIIRAFIGSPCD